MTLFDKHILSFNKKKFLIDFLLLKQASVIIMALENTGLLVFLIAPEGLGVTHKGPEWKRV